MKVQVELWGANRAGRKKLAAALIEARVTPTMLVVQSGEITYRVRPGVCPIFVGKEWNGKPMRFHLKDGRRVGWKSSLLSTWFVPIEERNRVLVAIADGER